MVNNKSLKVGDIAVTTCRIDNMLGHIERGTRVMKNPHNNGRADQVCNKLSHKVETDHNGEQVHHRIAAAQLRKSFPEEQLAAQSKQTGVYNRANHSRQNNGQPLIYLPQGMEHQTGQPASKDALCQNGDHSAEVVNAIEERGVRLQQNHNGEHAAQHRTGGGTIHCSANNNRNQHQRNGHRTDLNEAAQQLQDHHDGGHDGNTYHATDFCIFQKNSSLLSLRRSGWDAIIYLPVNRLVLKRENPD